MLQTKVIQFINANKSQISNDDLGQLTRHLEMVQEVTDDLVAKLQAEFRVHIPREELSLGAALHDIGKIFYPEEIHGEGNRHEGEDVYNALLKAGFTQNEACFSRLHTEAANPNAWAPFLIVALADVLWRGGRDMDLELRIPESLGGDKFEDSGFIDEMCEEISKHGLKRLQYQKEGLLQ